MDGWIENALRRNPEHSRVLRDPMLTRQGGLKTRLLKSSKFKVAGLGFSVRVRNRTGFGWKGHGSAVGREGTSRSRTG